jgi:hypothetical protein
MKKNALNIVLVSIVMFNVGCITYTSYIQKQTKNLSRALARISPSKDPVHGTALILLPSDVEILKHYLDFSAFLQLSDVEIQRNCINYVPDKNLMSASRASQKDAHNSNFSITIAKNNLQFVADAIRKSSIFNSVSVAYQDGNPASFPIGDYDYIVFIDVDGWFLRGRNNLKPLPISLEKDKLPLDSLQQQAKALRSN